MVIHAVGGRRRVPGAAACRRRGACRRCRFRRTTSSMRRSGFRIRSSTRRTRCRPTMLAKIRLDQALADKSWTAATEQTGDFADLPPAVILDADETAIDNGAYESWLVKTGNDYSGKTWAAWVADADAKAMPGRGRLHQIRRLQGREGFLRHQPQRRSGRGDPQEHGSPRLPDGRQCRHLPDVARSRTTGRRRRAPAAPSSPRTIASCSSSATTTATSPTTTAGRKPTAPSRWRPTPPISATTGSSSPTRNTARSSRRRS